jgi:hypothetical protein
VYIECLLSVAECIWSVYNVYIGCIQSGISAQKAWRICDAARISVHTERVYRVHVQSLSRVHVERIHRVHVGMSRAHTVGTERHIQSNAEAVQLSHASHSLFERLASTLRASACRVFREFVQYVEWLQTVCSGRYFLMFAYRV